MVRVASNKAHDDGFFFSPLKPVHASQFDTLEGLFDQTGYQSKLSALATPRPGCC